MKTKINSEEYNPILDKRLNSIFNKKETKPIFNDGGGEGFIETIVNGVEKVYAKNPGLEGISESDKKFYRYEHNWNSGIWGKIKCIFMRPYWLDDPNYNW